MKEEVKRERKTGMFRVLDYIDDLFNPKVIGIYKTRKEAEEASKYFNEECNRKTDVYDIVPWMGE